jgi:hypothetical protein
MNKYVMQQNMKKISSTTSKNVIKKAALMVLAGLRP